MIYSLGALVLLTPLSLLIRHKPEKYGYLPDGEANDSINNHKTAPESLQTEVDITAKQALKGSTFWHITLALTIHLIILLAVITHVMPYLSTIGFTRSYSGFIASAIPMISITGRLGSGWLGDKFDKRWVATGCFTIMGLGLLAFNYVSHEAIAMIFPFAIFFGIGWGGNTTLRAALLREYFGRSRFGSILGLTMGMLALGTIIGPLFAGWVFDNRNSYHAAWLTFACFVFIALIIVMTTPSVSNHIQSIKKQ